MSKTIRDEPIAVVGIGCRFPGASGVEQLWEVLREGRDTISEIPPDRFDTEAWLASEPREAGKIVSREGGIVNGIDLFDAEFFGLSAREASQMDPQQRILLEVAWEAFEDAGIVPARLAGGDSGVFIGMLTNDYEDLLFERHEELGVYGLVGGYRNAAAGRISYAFDLRGPNVVVDAACASSLLAIHLACESLRTGESSLAVAGGTNLILEPQPSIGFSQAGMLAADGRCKFGDARGDGFVRSDGAALVVLESLSAARAAGRRIYAVIRGGATNNDGVSSGYLMTPSVEGQVDVLRKAYSRAEVSPAEVAYVEAHGTGTSAGDPVELKALGQVLGERDLERSLEEGGAAPFEVGSIKTNLGHTEGAAGVAGLIKTALVLHHGEIPPSLHLQEPNPSIPWDELPLSIPTELHAWPEKSRRLAAVSSFGITGVNVHLVLSSEADLDLASGAASPGAASSGAASPDEMDIEPGAHLFTLSARSPQALQELTKATAERLDGRQTESLADLCYTSHLHRSHLEYRAAFPTTSLEDLRERLREYDEAEQDATVEQAPPVVFVFAGQGSQWRGMTRELYRTEPVFREALERCGEALSREVDWSLLEELASDESDAILERTDVVQPTLFAVQVALAALWRSWGVEPAAVIGQSMGEVAAAHVAGALSLEDAARVICRRSRLVLKASGRGSMASTELSLDQARSLLERYEGVSIAVGSGPSSTVLAGDPDALEQIGKELAEREIFFRFVQVDYASHSPQMDPLLPELGELLAEVRPQAGELPFFSTVRAERISGVELDADYWVRNLREPVLFGSTVENVLEAFPEPLAFLEVGPHPVVLGAVRQSVAHHGRESLLLPSLRRDEPEREMLLTSLGALYEAGVEVNGSALHLRGGRLVRMPLYHWQRERFWLNEKRTRTQRRADEHPLLGVRTRPAASPEGSFWQTEISVEEMPELADHRVRGIPALPAAAYLESALHCGRELFSLPAEHALVVEQASFENLLSFSEGVPETVQWTASRLRPGDVSSAGARLSAHQQIEDGPGLGWKLLASARVRVVPTGELDASGDAAIEASSIDTSSMESFSVDTFYEELRAGGLDYGPHYRGLTELRRGSGEASGTLRPPATGGPWLLRPELLDAALHLLFASLPAPHAGARPATWLPVFLGRLIFLGTPIAGEKIFARARLNSLPGKDDDALVGDVVLHRADGTCLARVEGMQMKRLDGRRGVESFFYQTVWREEELETDQAPAGRWLIFADTGGAGEELARFLDAAGASSTLLTELSEETLAEAAAQSWDGVVHLASLDLDSLPDDPAATAEAIERVRRRGVDPVVRWLQALDAASTDLPNLWIVTRGAWNDENFGAVDGESFAQAPVWGFGRTLPYELPDLVVRCVDLDPADDMATQSKRLAVELAGAAPYEQVVLRETRRVARPEPVRPAEKQEPVSLAVPTGPYRLVPAASGLLDDLRLQPIDLGSPGPHEARIEVRAAALNFHDVLDALGSLPFSARGDDIGLDFSGVVLEVGAEVTDLAPGDEVLGIAPQCIGSQVNARRELLLPKTAAWSFDQAASMPVVYLTAWYALCDRAQLRSGERVLIHAGTGGVGMAAIRIAQQIGAEIYATAGSEEKRDFLRSLGVEHVFDSRSLAFVDGILRQTEGAGVDVVLNSLAGEFLTAGVSLLRPYGRFLEIGKADLHGHRFFEIGLLKNNLSFYAIDLSDMIKKRPEDVGRLLREIDSWWNEHQTPPLPVRSFLLSDAPAAFRFMAQAKHLGKLVLTVPDPEENADGKKVRSDKTYLITGGFGGLGLATARALAEAGARSLALLGRSGAPANAREQIDALAGRGVKILELRGDVADPAGMKKIFDDLVRDAPPVAGIFHTAGRLDDSTVLELDASRFASVMQAKVEGAWNLHLLSRDLDLDHFVLYSSVAGLIGSPGQSNYCAANAFLDAFAEARRACGLPASSIQWGPWLEVGLAAERGDRGDRLAARGLAGITPQQGREALARAWDLNLPVLAVLPLDPVLWSTNYPTVRNLPFFQDWLRDDETSERGRALEETGYQRLFDAAPEERREMVGRYVVDRLAVVLGISSGRLRVDRPLSRLGMDSLMAVELRNRMEADLGISIPMTRFLRGADAAALIDHLDEQLGRPSSVAAPEMAVDSAVVSSEAVNSDALNSGALNSGALNSETVAIEGLIDQVDEMSDDEVDAMLRTLAESDL